MLVGKILHSPYPHARIKRIDTSRAEKLDGVVAVVVGKDAPNPYGILPVGHDEYALALDKVRYVGDNVACVAAVDEATAEKALELIDVEYEAPARLLRSRRFDEGRDQPHPRQQAAQPREGLSPRIRRSREGLCRGRPDCRSPLHRQRSHARRHGAACHAGCVRNRSADRQSADG